MDGRVPGQVAAMISGALLLGVAPDASSVAGPLAFVALQGAVVGLGALGARARRSRRASGRAAPTTAGRTAADRRSVHRPHPAR